MTDIVSIICNGDGIELVVTWCKALRKGKGDLSIGKISNDISVETAVEPALNKISTIIIWVILRSHGGDAPTDDFTVRDVNNPALKVTLKTFPQQF